MKQANFKSNPKKGRNLSTFPKPNVKKMKPPERNKKAAEAATQTTDIDDGWKQTNYEEQPEKKERLI